jgi:2-haloacid dehalogenase
MRALRAKGIPVFALTNFGIESFAYAQTQYDFLNEFDRPYVSGHMRVIKPDPRIYEMVEEDSGLSGASLLFADDRPDNIERRGRGAGTRICSKGPEGWAKALVDHGLLTEEEARP